MNLSLAVRRCLLTGPKTQEQVVAECGRLVPAAQARAAIGGRTRRVGGKVPKTQDEVLAYGRRQKIYARLRDLRVHGLVKKEQGVYLLTEKGRRLAETTPVPPERAALLKLLNGSESIPYRRGILDCAFALGQLTTWEHTELTRMVRTRHVIRNPVPLGNGQVSAPKEQV